MDDDYDTGGVAAVRTPVSSVPVRPEAIATHPRDAAAEAAEGGGGAVSGGDALGERDRHAGDTSVAVTTAARNGKKRGKQKCQGERQREQKKHRREGE